jgi:hypothetical protein
MPSARTGRELDESLAPFQPAQHLTETALERKRPARFAPVVVPRL